MKKHIPNTITCLNLVSGCIAIYQAFQGDYEMALFWIVSGAVFDFFDGMAARLLGVSSPIGKELDSLADVVTFGVAPSAMLFHTLSGIGQCSANGACPMLTILPYFAFAIAAFSALRLAKFNLDERQAMGFIGLPTPANALFWGSFIVGWEKWNFTTEFAPTMFLLGIMVSCQLLVSEIPMFALKFKHWGWKDNEVRYLFLLSCVPFLAFFGISGIALIIAWYVILSVLTKNRQHE
ncbi:MAG: CDP-diacylglycerol--serine O-phosphatidyltransferase [Prevotella sp.]|nr:CDP-diacylglycerol--serine O-phosphatidyltransferase [Prevotella sp.]